MLPTAGSFGVLVRLVGAESAGGETAGSQIVVDVRTSRHDHVLVVEVEGGYVCWGLDLWVVEGAFVVWFGIGPGDPQPPSAVLVLVVVHGSAVVIGEQRKEWTERLLEGDVPATLCLVGWSTFVGM
jgi:hypothetical protein